MSDYAIAPLKDISGTIQDPVLWISIILGGIRIGPKVLAAIPEYLCIDGDCGNEINGIDAVFPKNPDQLKHIFRNAVGHLTYDNPSNRDLLLKTVSPDNFIEVNQWGNLVFSRIIKDGSLVWVIVRDGIIQNGGVNIIP